jgi:hypothetical protein
MTTLRQAAEQALDALSELIDCGTEAWGNHRLCVRAGLVALNDLRQALKAEQQAEQQAEPVAFEFYNPATGHAIVDYSEHTHLGHLSRELGYIARPLVRPQPAQQPLTEEQIQMIDANTHFHESPDWLARFARAIERAHHIGGAA